MGAVTSAVLATAAVVGTQQQIRQSNIAKRNADKAASRQERLDRFQAARERRRQINASLRSRAGVVNAAGSGGLLGSSAAITQASAGAGQAASNIGAMNAINAANQEISLFNQRQADALSRANTAGAIAGLGMQGVSLFGPPTLPGSDTADTTDTN